MAAAFDVTGRFWRSRRVQFYLAFLLRGWAYA